MKRYRVPKAKDGELMMYWGKAQGEGPTTCLHWGDGVPHQDASSLSDGMRPVIKELASRGYDITTLRLTVRKVSRD